MKKMIAAVFTFMLAVAALSLSVSAYDGTQYGNTGIYYEINGGEVTIVDADEDIETANIPKSIGGYPVTSIGDDAFRYCSGLKNITIPNSIENIGEEAFYSSGLESINIPSSVKTVGDGAFSNCQNLTSVNISSGIKQISFAMFRYSSKITQITIPNSVEIIEEYAFSWCSGLTSVIIPESVKSIKRYAFDSCSALKYVTIPKNVTSIEDSAFTRCRVLESVSVNDGNTVYHSQNNCLIKTESKELVLGCKSSLIPDDGSVTSIGDSAFYGCTGITDITIPNSVTSIGDFAFYGCYGLTNITIGKNVTSIGDSAFYNCNSLTKVVIPNGVRNIRDSTFIHCTGLTSIVIPNSVVSIENGAFYGCTGLTRITIPNSVTSIERNAFVGCPFTEIKIGIGLESIGEDAFNGIEVIPEIYYAGSEAEWKEISIDSSNDMILCANMHYNAGISHTHSYTETVTQKATCTVDGVKTFTCDCGESYTGVISATGHKVVTDAAVSATCTEKGKTEGKHCSVCGEVLVKQTEIPAKGHTEVTDKAAAATCTKGGKTAGSHCSVCGKVLVAQKATKALDHKNKTTLTKATTSKDGKIVTACTVCKTVSKTTVISKVSSVKLAKTSYIYNGKTQKPKVTVKDSKGKLLSEGKDYTVKYQSDRKNPGKYTVTVTFKGNYSGKKTLTFTIAPKAPTLKASAAKKSAKLSWNKQTGATGYTVYMATSKNGKYKKIATVKGNKVSYTKTGLTKGKTYYFKVAAYTTSGGKTINGAYSKVKSVKVK